MKERIDKITSLITILSLLLGCIIFNPFVTKVEAYSIQYNEVSYTYDDLDTLIELIAEQISIMDAAHDMAEAGRKLGYDNSHDVINLAKEEYLKAEELAERYQNIYDELLKHWHQKEEEYPVATYIWSYLKDLGYSNQVCAGILGNIMREVGGGDTLNLQYDAHNPTHYGICQWSKTYYPDVWGASLEIQCDYLRDTIQDEFNIFGSNYKKDFGYQDFIRLTDTREAAAAFALCYERCGNGNYSQRVENAIVAYSYFIS